MTPAPVIDDDRLPKFGARDAADILGIDYHALLRLVRAGRIGHSRHGKYVRFSVAQLRDYIEAAERPVETYDRKVREIVDNAPVIDLDNQDPE